MSRIETMVTGAGRRARRLATAIAALALGTGLAGTAAAQDMGSGWTGQVTPYVWATGVGGTIRPFGGAPTVRIDKSFSEIIKDLDAAFFISGYARRDRFVLFGDLSHSSSSRSGLVGPGIPASGALRQTSLTFAGGYRAVNEPGATLDVLAGARAWDIRARASVPLAGITASRSVSFVDPIIAARTNLQIAPGWSFIAYGDVGGFGVGSHFTGQVAATINYQVNDRVWLSGGYRYLHVDYRKGGTRINASMSGPLFGATLRF